MPVVVVNFHVNPSMEVRFINLTSMIQVFSLPQGEGTSGGGRGGQGGNAPPPGRTDKGAQKRPKKIFKRNIMNKSLKI